MSKLHLCEGDQAAGDTQKRQSRHSTSIKVSSRLTTGQILTDEGFASNSGKSDSNSRMSTRRFTSSYVERVWNVQTSQFAGMDISTVIPAGSLRSPSVDLLSLYLDIHRVSSANFLDSIPANGDLFKGIGDGNSFIEEGHLGANKTQVKEVGDHKGPADRDCNLAITPTEKTLRADSSTEEVDGRSEEVTTSRTVHLRITHRSSLSRKVMR
jgi:hypothetical protein